MTRVLKHGLFLCRHFQVIPSADVVKLLREFMFGSGIRVVGWQHLSSELKVNNPTALYKNTSSLVAPYHVSFCLSRRIKKVVALS